MKLTNKYNLPSPIVRAIEFPWYHKEGNISVTALVSSPRQRILALRHNEEITEDVSDRIWSLIGHSIHRVLEAADVPEAFQEERLTINVNGWNLSGKADLWEPPGTLSDFKITSVWSFVDGIKPEWEKQLNIYAYIWKTNGFPVNKLQVVGILRDWQRSRVGTDNYPPCGVVCVPVDLWPVGVAEQFISERIIEHQNAEKLSDNELPFCNASERWEEPEVFAVRKNDGKRAMRLLPSKEEAEKYIEKAKLSDQTSKFSIECRPCTWNKCDGYCSVSLFCNQWNDHIVGKKK